MLYRLMSRPIKYNLSYNALHTLKSRPIKYNFSSKTMVSTTRVPQRRCCRGNLTAALTEMFYYFGFTGFQCGDKPGAVVALTPHGDGEQEKNKKQNKTIQKKKKPQRRGLGSKTGEKLLVTPAPPKNVRLEGLQVRFYTFYPCSVSEFFD